MNNIFHIQKGSHGGGTLVKDNGGGAGFFEIQLTSIDEGEFTADKTYEEITKALQDGLYPIINAAGMAKVPFTGFDYDGRNISFVTTIATGISDDGYLQCEHIMIACTMDNTWIVNYSRMQ